MAREDAHAVETARLVERAKSGDRAAFGSLYDDFAPKLFRFFRYRGTPPEAAEDLTQRVFVKLIESLPRYRASGTPFEAWLFRVARNAWIDEDRRRRPSVPIEALAESPSPADGPDAVTFDALERELVRRAVAQLPRDQREVVACRFFAGLSPAETAAQIGRSEGAVRSLQHRALGALRRRLPGLDGAPTNPTRSPK